MLQHDDWMAGLGVNVQALKAVGDRAEGSAPGGVDVQPFHLQINLFNRTTAPLQLVSGSERTVPLVPPARYLSPPPASIAPSGGGAFIITNEDPSGVPHAVPTSGSIAYALAGDPDGAVFSLQWMREAGAPAQSAVATVSPASAAARFEVQRDAGAAGQIAFQFIPVAASPAAPAVQPPAEPQEIDLRMCKLVPNQVDGPKNHMLCSVHGHVVDSDASTVVATSIDEYHKTYWIGRPITDCQPDPGKLPHAPKNIVVCKKHGEVYDTTKGIVLANTRTMYLRAHPEHAGPAAKAGGEKGKGRKAMTTSATPDTPPALGDLLNATLVAAKQLGTDLEQYAGASWDDCEGCKLEAAAMAAALGPLVVGTATLTTALSVEVLSVGAASGAAIPVACGAAMGMALGAGGLLVANVAYESCLNGRLANAPAGSDARARIVAAKQQLDALKQRIAQDQARLSAAWEALKAGVRASA